MRKIKVPGGCDFCQNDEYNTIVNKNIDFGDVTLFSVELEIDMADDPDLEPYEINPRMSLWLWNGCDDPIYENHIRISYCPFCGRKLFDEVIE